MRLFSINLHGYRTFADSTTIPLSPKTTCFVGPNGVGKSALIEAFKWILGIPIPGEPEQLVFHGTKSRPPCHKMEVSLTVDQLPIPTNPLIITQTYSQISRQPEYQTKNPNHRLGDLPQWLEQIQAKCHFASDESFFKKIVTKSPRNEIILLDEIENDLDYQSLQQFQNDLKSLCSQNQVIVVTHNKDTMTLASEIVGISMEEYGVAYPIPMRMR